MTVEESVRKRGSIGKPLMMTEARIAGPDDAEAADGEVGELLLRGPHVSLGYWNDPEATAAALDASGWFHTGDLARRDAEGFFTIAGRRKDMFISGGVNVYPAEIEGELLLHPEVADAAVIGVAHATWGEVGAAFVVRRPGTAVGEAELTAHLAGRLAKFKWPKHYVFPDALPRSAYGKVLKPKLQELWAGMAVGREGGRRPEGFGGPAILTHVVEGAGPPVVLLNGGLMSIRAWDPVAARLTTRWRVVRCDFRGQFASPGTPPPDLAGHAADLVALLDHLGIARAHLAGTSFGALVALVAAAQAPAHVASVVALTATDYIEHDQGAGLDALARLAEEAAAGGDGVRLFDALEPFTFSPDYRERHASAMAARRAAIAQLPRSYYAGLRGLLSALRGADLRPVLPRVPCPVLVAAAGEDLTFPPARSAALAAGLPDGRLEILPGAAHGVAVERPEDVAALIDRFVTAVEAPA
jgi:pimeloyl-ACP methyl ester carboxylesterase